MRQFNICITLTVVLLVSVQRNEACRILDKEIKYWKPKDLVLQSLERGPVPPSGNGCTYIPGGGDGHCTNQMNFAGLAMPPPQVYPGHTILFGVSQSLQKGPVPPSGSGCTYIPGGSRHCVNQMNSAGRVMPPPPVYPDNMLPFGVATDRK